MSFTDDDLKRIKENIEKYTLTGGLTGITSEKYNALLHRLECAEKVCSTVGEDAMEMYAHVPCDWHMEIETCVSCNAYIAMTEWKKSKETE